MYSAGFTILFSMLVLFMIVVFLHEGYISLRKLYIKKSIERKLRKALSGLLFCEEEGCLKAATHRTHSGYYCSEHYEQHSIYHPAVGGRVIWSQRLRSDRKE